MGWKAQLNSYWGWKSSLWKADFRACCSAVNFLLLIVFWGRFWGAAGSLAMVPSMRWTQQHLSGCKACKAAGSMAWLDPIHPEVLLSPTMLWTQQLCKLCTTWDDAGSKCALDLRWWWPRSLAGLWSQVSCRPSIISGDAKFAELLGSWHGWTQPHLRCKLFSEMMLGVCRAKISPAFTGAFAWAITQSVYSSGLSLTFKHCSEE